MTTLSHSESRRKYSWWWDSHNTPKNSKWLQENITDMDGKVKSMIKLIEEDADSFARRAEMYYKKRPELMKLVEDFYRAYRALAERYNHATGELKHAHQTIAAAFPDQVPPELIDDLKEGDSDAVFVVDALINTRAHSEEGVARRGLKQLQEMFGGSDGVAQTSKSELSTENQNLREKVVNEIERAGKAKKEVQTLKKVLADAESEKKNVMLKYQQCLEKLSKMERELSNAEMESTSLNEKACRAEIEVQTLKESLVQFEVEKIAGMIKHRECLEKISCLEGMASRFEEADGRAFEAESRARNLEAEITKLDREKEGIILQYQQCLVKISGLEDVILASRNEASELKRRAECAEGEMCKLEKAVADLKEQKEASALQYKKLTDDVKSLNDKILIQNEKLKSAEGKCSILDISNRALQIEADDLAKKIKTKDIELFDKQKELEKLQSCLNDENLRHAEAESALQNLYDLRAKSKDEQKALVLELETVLQKLNEMEADKCGLEEEIQNLRDENRVLSETVVSMEDMENEVRSLRDLKEKLVEEVSHHSSLSVSSHEEISCLKKEIEGLSKSYKDLVNEMGAETRFKDENMMLKRICEEEINEKEILLKKLETAECSLSDEKTNLVAEKASLLSQMQLLTENMNNVAKQNGVLEHSLYTAKSELEGLREKSKRLEEICDLLKSERSYLMSERDALVLKLENVEKRSVSLEKKFNSLEEKYADLEKENEAAYDQVDELKVCLDKEKRERIGSVRLSEKRMAGLENEMHLLQEENRCTKKISEEELDKAAKAQFEMSILQKFMKDMEEKNCSLIIECQKHVEASKLAEKLISELEGESLEQQVEAEMLLDEIERLRLGIFKIFQALEIGMYEDEDERALINHVLTRVESMKSSICKSEDEKQLLFVENSVLLALLEELKTKGNEIELQKARMEKDYVVISKKLAVVEDKKNQLCVKQDDLQKGYDALHEAYSRVYDENTNLLKKLSDLFEEKHIVDQQNDALVGENLTSANQSLALERFAKEKINEVRLLLEDAKSRHEDNARLGKEMAELGRRLDLQKNENLDLKERLLRSEEKLVKTTEVRKDREKDVFQLTETNSEQRKEIKRLQCELNSLQGKNNELQLREAEAATFCFDFQASINEVLLKDKVEELTGAYKILENKHAEKMKVIEQMRGRMCLMETEVCRLKTRISAYTPVIESLTDDIMLVEHNALLRAKVNADDSHDSESSGGGSVPPEDPSLMSLHSLRTRVKAVGKLMIETSKPVLQRTSSIRKSKQQSTAKASNRKKWNANELMKDIPLIQSSSTRKTRRDDQMLELCQSDGVPSTDSDMDKDLPLHKSAQTREPNPDYEMPNDEKILNKLDNDAEKLETLHATVEHLRWKLEMNKKGKKTKTVEFESVKQQLQEAEDTIVSLLDLNVQLVKNIEDCPPDEMLSPKLKQTVKTWRSKVLEQAEKGSERIEKLGVLVQTLVERFDDESKKKGRSKLLKSRSITLRNFIDNGKRKKGPRSGCFTQSTSRKQLVNTSFM